MFLCLRFTVNSEKALIIKSVLSQKRFRDNTDLIINAFSEFSTTSFYTCISHRDCSVDISIDSFDSFA